MTKEVCKRCCWCSWPLPFIRCYLYGKRIKDIKECIWKH